MYWISSKKCYRSIFYYHFQWIRLLCSSEKKLYLEKKSHLFGKVGSWGSYVGIRPVSLMDGPFSTCMVTGTVQHELTHVLGKVFIQIEYVSFLVTKKGFYHEQSRPDRDLYVSIQWANINPSQFIVLYLKSTDNDRFVLDNRQCIQFW